MVQGDESKASELFTKDFPRSLVTKRVDVNLGENESNDPRRVVSAILAQMEVPPSASEKTWEPIIHMNVGFLRHGPTEVRMPPHMTGSVRRLMARVAVEFGGYVLFITCPNRKIDATFVTQVTYE